MLMNNYAWPVAMEKIGWRTYIIFAVWDVFQAIVIYFLIPETKNRTVSPILLDVPAAEPSDEEPCSSKSLTTSFTLPTRSRLRWRRRKLHLTRISASSRLRRRKGGASACWSR